MLIHHHETIVIFNPSTTKVKEEISEYRSFISGFFDAAGLTLSIEDIGVKRLAYDMKGEHYGHYVKITWWGSPENVLELERKLRVDDEVLKFITMRLTPETKEIEKDVKTEQRSDLNNDQQQEDDLDLFDLIYG